MNLLPPPGPQRQRQLTVLGVLVVILAAYYGYLHWPTASGAATSSNTGSKTTAATRTEHMPVPDPVKLPSLDPAPENSQPTRNPFRFGAPPPPPPPPPMPERPIEPVKPQLPTPPPAPQVPLKLLALGSVTETKQRLVNLLDPESGAQFWVKEGAVIDGKYKLVKVNADSVIVAFRDGTGQKPLYVEK